MWYQIIAIQQLIFNLRVNQSMAGLKICFSKGTLLCRKKLIKSSCSHEPFSPLKYTSCYGNILHVRFKTSKHDTTARFELYVVNKLDGYQKMLLFCINRQKKCWFLKVLWPVSTNIFIS